LKKRNWQIEFGIFLIILTIILYSLQYLINHDVSQVVLYILSDVDFLPLEVLIVSLILHRVIAQREKMNMLKKLNMVIGAFFSEVGVHLLKELANADFEISSCRDKLVIGYDWQNNDFKNAANVMKKYDFVLEIEAEQIENIKKFLLVKRNFMLRLLENPNLLEHDSFTEILWAVFHITDELGAREDITKELENDYQHLVIDLQRVYRLLTLEWITYMNHLKNDYPYLYSFAVRTNPFNPEITPEIK